MSLPTEAKARKDIPIYSGCIKYFPKALAAVAELSRIGNDQHNPGEPLHWAREKSTDELDALLRHLVEAGTIDTDGVRHSTKVAWRALANLEKEIENARAIPEGPYRCTGSSRTVDDKCSGCVDSACKPSIELRTTSLSSARERFIEASGASFSGEYS